MAGRSQAADETVFPVAGSASFGRDRAAAFDRAERHSRRVRRLKLLLPLIAVCAAVVFYVYSYVLPEVPIAMDVAGTSVSEGKLVMANPKLEGFTKDDKPYSMTADRAVQDFDRQGIIDLEGISARMPVEEGNWAEVRADTGIYDRDANTIQLDTNVLVTTTDGMVARLATAFLDIDEGSLRSERAVDIRMKGSSVTANSMRVLENGRVVVFEGKVRMNIEPGQVKSAQQLSGGVNASN